MHDNVYIELVESLLESVLTQMDDALRTIGPAMGRTADDVKGRIDLSPFKQRFVGNDKDLAGAFDQMTADLVKLTLREASLR